MQGGGGSPISVHIQDQVGWGSEESDLVEDISAHRREGWAK